MSQPHPDTHLDDQGPSNDEDQAPIPSSSQETNRSSEMELIATAEDERQGRVFGRTVSQSTVLSLHTVIITPNPSWVADNQERVDRHFQRDGGQAPTGHRSSSPDADTPSTSTQDPRSNIETWLRTMHDHPELRDPSQRSSSPEFHPPPEPAQPPPGPHPTRTRSEVIRPARREAVPAPELPFSVPNYHVRVRRFASENAAGRSSRAPPSREAGFQVPLAPLQEEPASMSRRTIVDDRFAPQSSVKDVAAALQDREYTYDGLPPSSQPRSEDDADDDAEMADAEEGDEASTPRAGARSLPDCDRMDEGGDFEPSSSSQPQPASPRPPVYPEPCTSPPPAEPEPLPTGNPLSSQWDGLPSSYPAPDTDDDSNPAPVVPKNNDTDDDADDVPDSESESPGTPLG